MTGDRLASTALGLVGTRFRLHGRDPAIGLDCVGLLEAAMRRIGRPCRLPNGYTLRHRHEPDFERIALAAGFAPSGPEAVAGDVTIFRSAPAQCHLAIVCGENRIVHAHAGLRCVVEGPVPENWTRLARFRLTELI